MEPSFSDRKSWNQLFLRWFTKNSLDLVNLFSVPWGYRLFAKKLLVPNFGTVWYQKKTVCFGCFQTFEHMKMCQTYDVCFIFNLGNKNLGIYCHLSLILCHFWRQNCLKTSILLLWATLVNTCWPYVCDITKWSLGARKYLSQVPSPQISRQEIQNSSRRVEKTIFYLYSGLME